MRRREFLGLAAIGIARLKPSVVVDRRGGPMCPPQAGTQAGPDLARGHGQDVALGFSRADFERAPGYAVDVNGAHPATVALEREWNGPLCRSRIVNRARAAVRIREVVLADVKLSAPPSTALYGEGFQMLTQTGGTLGAPIDFSQYTDAKHYRIPQAAGARTFYGLVTLTPPGAETSLAAFTSCTRFSGAFVVQPSSLRAVVDCEGLTLQPGEAWPLEELMVASGSDRAKLLAAVGDRLAAQHPRLSSSTPPTGWCSWYCFGPRVTAQQVLDNLDAIAKTLPGLKYVQIDDGYQSAMGDWLETGNAFGGNVRSVLDAIRRRGFEPAIWVAPFVAEEQSGVFTQHPDWFIKDAAGSPLRSDRVTFGGWRRGPWYALDGTHPDVQRHFENLFRTMRRDWGCTYFKLDANFWGAMHGGRFHDPRATRVEAYRRGMQAIGRGAGDAFLLGCNHPIWPSAGLIHGSRSSNDIKRSWDRVMTTARQNLSRNWQNGRVWWNDPDAVVLAGELTDVECVFHATAIYASGGMVLSGDDLTAIPAARAEMLKKLLPPTGVAAEFEDERLHVGVVRLPSARMYCLFNWDDAPQSRSVRIDDAAVVDYWTGETLAARDGAVTIEMAPRSARILRVTA
jgi:alpha-galactosidase